MSLVKCWVAWLLSSATLCSALSAKLAPGELRRLCPRFGQGEHLSRESRKLTVMMQRETGQPLDDLSESIGFLRFNEGPLPGQAHTCPEFGRAQLPPRSYLKSLIVKHLWLSESVKAL